MDHIPLQCRVSTGNYRFVLCHLLTHMEISTSTNAWLLRNDGCVRACRALARHFLDKSVFAMLDPCHLYLSGLLLPLLIVRCENPSKSKPDSASLPRCGSTDGFSPMRESLSKKSHQNSSLASETLDPKS